MSEALKEFSCDFLMLKTQQRIAIFYASQGAIVGGFLGLVIIMWMGIGSYLVGPVSLTLPTNTSGCGWNETLAFNDTTVAPTTGEISEQMYVQQLMTVTSWQSQP